MWGLGRKETLCLRMLEHLYSRAQEHEGLGFWGLGFRVSIAYWFGCENPDFQNPYT